MRTAFAFVASFLLSALVVPAEQPAGPVKVGAFTFAVPEGWKSVTPSSSMRKAQLEVAQGSDKAEVTFFQFGAGQGGSVADNVARWFAQFPGSEDKRKTEAVQAGPVKITYVTTEGTFSSGMPGRPDHADDRLRALRRHPRKSGRKRLYQNDRAGSSRERRERGVQEDGFRGRQEHGATGLASTGDKERQLSSRAFQTLYPWVGHQ